MTREDVQKLLMMISAAFPNFKVENKTETINTWLMLTEEYKPEEMLLAFKSYCKSNDSGFAPSVPKLIAELDKVNDLVEMDVLTAWGLVRKAIGRSTYNSADEFAKLPPTVQKAVGSAEVLRSWALDEDYSEGVVMSAFRENYKRVCQRERDYQKMPEPMKVLVDNTLKSMGRIGIKEPLKIATPPELTLPPVEDVVKRENGEHFIDTTRYITNLLEQLKKQE